MNYFILPIGVIWEVSSVRDTGGLTATATAT